MRKLFDENPKDPVPWALELLTINHVYEHLQVTLRQVCQRSPNFGTLCVVRIYVYIYNIYEKDICTYVLDQSEKLKFLIYHDALYQGFVR